MASLSSLDSDSLSAPLPTPPSTCLLPPFSFPSSQASIPDLAYLALPCPAAAGLLASSLLPPKHVVILACPPCGTPLCALFPSALSPTPLLHHRYALPPSTAPNLTSHPSPRAACAHTSPSARASGMLQWAPDNSPLFLEAPCYALFLPPSPFLVTCFFATPSPVSIVPFLSVPPITPCSSRPFLGGVTSSVSPHHWEHFVFGVVAPSTAPRSGGSLAFGAVARSASPRSGGSLAFGAAAPSTSPRSGGFSAFVTVARSASPRSRGFAFVTVTRSASPRSRGFAFVTVARSASLRSGGFFAFVSVAPSTTPRNGGSFAFSLFSITAAPRDWGFFNFFLPIVIARRVHLHVVVATPSIHSAPASCQIPRIAGRGPPPGLRSDVQIRSASSSAHAHWRHQICAICRPPWRAHRRPPSLP
ncbi:unnamed protein product [Closterium sp. NIES-65]|nr:unnamed protein product [Closterium sp. NIES-65]